MCYVTHCLRFTSGATPADLLVASMAAELSLPHTCKALVGLETGSYYATTHSVRSGRPDALLTELSRFGCLSPLLTWDLTVQGPLLVVTSGVQDWRPVQTCSLEAPSTSADIWRLQLASGQCAFYLNAFLF